MSRRVIVGLAWVAGLAATAAALQWAGSGPLAAPPLRDPGRWPAWLEGRDPVVAAFAGLRLVALAALWYLVAVTALGALLRMAGATTLVRVTDRFTISIVRRLLAGGVSLGLAASGVVAAAAPGLAQTTSTTIVPVPATVTMRLLGPADPVPAAPTPQVAPTSTARADRWTVKPGECFWSIAESVLAEDLGRAPSDAEIVPFWRRLIQANRHELASSDPDLIFPGQVFVVPAP